MNAMMEAIGAELAIRAALNEVIQHIGSSVLGANLRELEGEASRIENVHIREGYIRALASIQRGALGSSRPAPAMTR